jgi:hypothetical protein
VKKSGLVAPGEGKFKLTWNQRRAGADSAMGLGEPRAVGWRRLAS